MKPEERRRILRARIRLMLVVLGLPLAIGIGLLPDPTLRPAGFLALGGIAGGFFTLFLGVLLGKLGFGMFGVTRESLLAPPEASAPELADFGPDVPPVRKIEPSPRWTKIAGPVLVFLLLLMLLPAWTGVPRLIIGGGLLLFGLALVLGFLTGLTLLVARAMKTVGGWIFGGGKASDIGGF